MAKMMIRGGDLDLVEYEFPTFPPGKNLKTLGFEKKKYHAQTGQGHRHAYGHLHGSTSPYST